MVKVKAKISYKDLELKRTISVGEELEVTDERAKVLIEKKLAEIVDPKENEKDISKKATIKSIKKISPKKK